MNKQEKEKLKRVVENNISVAGAEYISRQDVFDEIDDMPETDLTTAQAWEKIAEEYDKEPEELHDILENATFYGPKHKKIKVPKWFAEYLAKIYFHDGYLTLKILWSAYAHGKLSEKTTEFVQNNVELVTRAVLYGYEPIEPLYIMPVPYMDNEWYARPHFNGYMIYTTNERERAHEFTAAEIDEYFPKIKEFAEEVTG